jgi:hypothetical protein
LAVRIRRITEVHGEARDVCARESSAGDREQIEAGEPTAVAASAAGGRDDSSEDEPIAHGRDVLHE